MKKILCHKCNTEMNETSLAKLEGEKIDKILEQLKEFFPFGIKNKKLQISILEMGYVLFLCSNCHNFNFIKKNDRRLN